MAGCTRAVEKLFLQNFNARHLSNGLDWNDLRLKYFRNYFFFLFLGWISTLRPFTWSPWFGKSLLKRNAFFSLHHRPSKNYLHFCESLYLCILILSVLLFFLLQRSSGKNKFIFKKSTTIAAFSHFLGWSESVIQKVTFRTPSR